MSMRISGLASGMDIDQLVSQMMKAERAPLDRLKQDIQLMEWKRDQYREINTKMLEFRDLSFDMKLQSTYLAQTATSSSESVVKATATPNATEGVYTLKVNKMASGGSLTAGAAVGVTSLSDTLEDIGMGTPGPTTLTIGGAKGTVSFQVETTQSIGSFINEVNSHSTSTGVKVSYDSNLDRFFFVSTSTGADAKVEISSSDSGFLTDVLQLTPSSTSLNGERLTSTVAFSDGLGQKVNSSLTGTQTLEITHNSETFEFEIDASTSIGSLITEINRSGMGKAGVSAYLDGNGNLNFFNEDSANPISFTDATADGEDLLASLGLATATTTAVAYDQVLGLGQDAEVEFNGITGTYSTNTLSINGITFDLKTEQAAMDSPVSITVNRNVDKIYDSIKAYVDKYNEMIDLVNGKLSEEKYREFLPLTDEQKGELSEDQVKKWEEKAMSGLLRSDMMLSGAMNNFRYGLAKSITGLSSGDLSTLAEIGIKTGVYTEKGKLHINEADLKAAISEKPDEVLNLFTSSDSSDSTGDRNGFAVRLYDMADNLIDQIIDKAGTSTSVPENFIMGKDMQRLDTEIYELTRKLNSTEERYYRQFTAMEKAINQMNSQSMYLLQQFGGGGA